MFSLYKKKSGPLLKIGILYVCTGKYHIFWDGFYKSARKYFCKDSEVHYFVFTDQPVKTYGDKLIHLINQPKLGWPFDTLMRFHMFLRERKELEKMDYLFFFNANMKFLKKINEIEILPVKENNFLTSVLHYGFYDHSLIAPFDNNPASTAFVEANIHLDYYQGSLSGGRTKEYLIMAEEIKKMVDIDSGNSIIARWHDESHMNKYFLTTKPKALSPSYSYPQQEKSSLPKNILMYDKKNFGGHDFLRNSL